MLFIERAASRILVDEPEPAVALTRDQEISSSTEICVLHPDRAQ